MLEVLTREQLSWLLAAFYFLTFGGFVAFSIYLPTLLKDEFHLAPADAGFRTAGFVVLATLLRPLGGWLSDRIGGARVLSAVFAGVAPFALLLAWPAMLPFTVGALGCAALLGLGNGAVFKLVPQYFPDQTGTVTGLVGAMGGLGGFFPPLLLAFFRSRTGVDLAGVRAACRNRARCSGGPIIASSCRGSRRSTSRFPPISAAPPTACAPAPGRRSGRRCWSPRSWSGRAICRTSIRRSSSTPSPSSSPPGAWSTTTTSGCEKPPTRVYWDRGWELYRRQGMFRSFGARRRARRHAPRRAAVHRASLAAALVDAPVPLLGMPARRRDHVSAGLRLDSLPHRSRRSVDLCHVPVRFPGRLVPAAYRGAHGLLFHGLDISAVLVLAGIALSLWRRMTDKGARTLQQFGMDFLPIILLFAISVTGLALTVSQEWLRGSAYSFLAILHAVTVIAALLFLPFGKFFHIFQRPAQLGVKLYQEAGLRDPGAMCARCGERFASRMHIDDLRAVLPQLGFDYRTPGPAAHWQELCPACKRKTLSVAQMRIKEESRG